MFRLSREKFVLLAILMILLPALSGFLKPGFYAAHDAVWHISRFWQFHLSLESGQFPVRWAPNLYFGLGYPAFVVNFHFPYYLMELIYRLGFGVVDTFKILITVSYMASIYFFYLYLRRFFAIFPAVTGVVVFAYSPYRFATMFARGALGEAVAIAFVPVVFLAFELWRSKNKYAGPFLALSFFLLVTSHTSIFTVFSPIFLVFIYLVFLRAKKLEWALLGWIALGVMASAFQLMPALFEKHYMVFDQVYNNVYLGHFVNLFSVFRIKIQGADVNTPFQIGVAGSVSVIAFLITRVRRLKLGLYIDKLAFVYLIGFFLGIFLMSRMSLIFWEKLPFFNLVLFPWRFINLILVCSAFLCAYVVSKKKLKILFAILFVFLAMFPSRHFLSWTGNIPTDDSYYMSYYGTSTAENEFMPVGVSSSVKDYVNPPIEVISGDMDILNQNIAPNDWQFTVKAQENSLIKLAVLNFPGWRAFIDKGQVNIIGNYKDEKRDLRGLILFVVSSGYHDIRVHFEETPLRRASDLISLAALVFLFGVFFKRRFNV